MVLEPPAHPAASWEVEPTPETAPPSLDALLREVVTRVRDLLAVDTVAVLLVDGDAVVPRAALGLGSSTRRGLRIPIGTGFAGKIAATGQPVMIDEVGDSDVVNPALREHGIHTLLGVPILFRQTLIGVLHVGALEPRRFGPEDVRLLQLAADRIGLGIAYARLYEEEASAHARAEAEQRRARFLGNVSALLATTLDYALTLKNLTRLAVPELGDWCVVDMVDADGVTLQRVAVACVEPAQERFVWDADRHHPLRSDDPYGPARVATTGEPELVSEITDEIVAQIAHNVEHVGLLRELGMTSYMSVPLVARGRTIGAISFATAGSGRRYSTDDLAFAEEVARRAALAVDNARLYREAQDMSRLRDEFLATISHELRTPLTPILSWAHLLRTRKLSEAAMVKAVEAIERGAKTQARLIDDLLDMSRVITGKLRLDVEPVEIAAVVGAALESMGPAAHGKRIAVRARLDPSAGTVLGDPARLQQVVWNLLANAIKFTPEGGNVDVTLEPLSSHVRLTVRDTGIGINPQFLDRVFDPFCQADSSTTRVHGGLGLGLAIVRQVVELHGGIVRVTSSGEGEGAAFIVDLPVATRSPAGAATPCEGTPSFPDRVRLDGRRVLVVDDQRDTCDALQAILEAAGAEVRACVSVAEALTELAVWRPDVLVSDLGMPGEDGYALIRSLRTRAADQAIPAVALTGYARVEDRAHALAAGFQRHVAKPVDAVAFVAVVAEPADHA